MNPSDTHAILLQRCANGDSAALRTLYDAVAPQLFSLLLRILKRHDLAQDALQEVFLSIWRNASKYRSAQGSPMAWLIGIARYRAIDVRRSLKLEYSPNEHIANIEDTLPDDRNDPTSSAGLDMRAQRLEDCMQELTTQQRRAIHFAFIDGFTHEEVAVRTESPVGTVKSWIRRGLKALKNCLGS